MDSAWLCPRALQLPLRVPPAPAPAMRHLTFSQSQDRAEGAHHPMECGTCDNGYLFLRVAPRLRVERISGQPSAMLALFGSTPANIPLPLEPWHHGVSVSCRTMQK